MKPLSWLILALSVVSAALSAAEPPFAPPPPPAQDLPHAGVRLCLPECLTPQWVSGEDEVLRAVLWEAGQPVKSLTLSMVKINDKESVEELADRMGQRVEGDLADLVVLKKTPMAVAGIEGSARLLRYRRGGQNLMAARVCFIRQFQEPKLRVCYVLEVEAAADREAKILPILGQVIKTLTLVPLQHPSAPTEADLGPPCRDTAGGYRIRPPRHWRLTLPPPATRPSDTGIQMAQVDHLLGGQETLSASVILTDVPAAMDAETYARNAVQAAAKVAAKDEASVRLLSQGAAKMGGLAGWQFVIERKGSASASGPPVLIAQRTVCEAGEAGRRRSFTLILVCRGQSPQAVTQAIDALAGGFELETPTTQPATKPATLPATAPK